MTPEARLAHPDDMRLQRDIDMIAAAVTAERERISAAVTGLGHGSSCALVVMAVGDCDCHLASVLRILVDQP